MSKSKTGVLIINPGHARQSFTVADVRKYLREFLMDARVIDIPYWRRFLLINLIIAPFRAPQSAKAYRELWTPQGSPLKVHGLALEKLLQQALGGRFPSKISHAVSKPKHQISFISQFENKGF